MKKVLVFCLAFALSLSVLAGCGDSSGSSTEPEAAGRTLEQIVSSGEIIMLTNAEFPPFEYMNGTVEAGVDVDVAREIAADLGVELKVVNMDFDGIIGALVSGKGDFGAAGMTILPERLENVDFSIEYVTSAQYIIMPEDKNYQTVEDLAGLRIGVQLGTTGDIIVSEQIDAGVLKDTGASVSQYKSGVEAAMDMQNGRLDAVVIDMHPANAIASSLGGMKTSTNAVSDSESYAIAVPKGNEELLGAINGTLRRLMDEGKIEEFLINHAANLGTQENPATPGEIDPALSQPDSGTPDSEGDLPSPGSIPEGENPVT